MTDFKRTIGLADMYGTLAEVDVLPADEDGGPSIHLSMTCGSSGARAMPTAEACRQLAAVLLDAADQAETGP